MEPASRMSALRADLASLPLDLAGADTASLPLISIRPAGSHKERVPKNKKLKTAVLPFSMYLQGVSLFFDGKSIKNLVITMKTAKLLFFFCLELFLCGYRLEPARQLAAWSHQAGLT